MNKDRKLQLIRQPHCDPRIPVGRKKSMLVIYEDHLQSGWAYKIIGKAETIGPLIFSKNAPKARTQDLDSTKTYGSLIIRN